jgi:hypothetical protein
VLGARATTSPPSAGTPDVAHDHGLAAGLPRRPAGSKLVTAVAEAGCPSTGTSATNRCVADDW